MMKVLRTPRAARYLGLSASMLERMRHNGTGPEFIRLGIRALGYDVATLDAWLDRQRAKTPRVGDK